MVSQASRKEKVTSGLLLFFFLAVSMTPMTRDLFKRSVLVKNLTHYTLTIMKEDKNLPKKDYTNTVRKVVRSVLKYSYQYHVDPRLILAIIHQECDFIEPKKRPNHAGAIGWMQIVPYPPKMRDLGMTVTDLYVLDKNIHAGVDEITRYLKQKKNVLKALYRYNGMHFKNGKKTVRISKESYYYGIKVTGYYFRYIELSEEGKWKTPY